VYIKIKQRNVMSIANDHSLIVYENEVLGLIRYKEYDPIPMLKMVAAENAICFPEIAPRLRKIDIRNGKTRSAIIISPFSRSPMIQPFSKLCRLFFAEDHLIHAAVNLPWVDDESIRDCRVIIGADGAEQISIRIEM